jgi:acetyl-CoA carboxylase beta subunit
MADEKRAARVDIGFSGGQVLSVRLEESTYQDLQKELSKGSEGWHDLRTEDSELTLHLNQVVYVRLDAEQHKVGF